MSDAPEEQDRFSHGWEALAGEAERRGSAAVAIAHPNGRIDEWWDSDGPRLVECMSVTKTVVALAAVMAVGKDQLDRPLATWIEEWVGDPRGGVTLRQVLRHTSRLEVRPSTDLYEASDTKELALGLHFEPDGPAFAYNNAAFQLVGLVVERASGATVDRFVADRVFSRLGVHDWGWQRDKAAVPLCFAGLQLRAADLVRVGRLFLAGGDVAPGRVLEVMRPGPGQELGAGCFAQYEWVDRTGAQVAVGPVVGFGHDGDYGQYLSIQPQLGVVAVRFRTVYERENDEAIWASFPGDVHRAFNDGAESGQ